MGEGLGFVGLEPTPARMRLLRRGMWLGDKCSGCDVMCPVALVVFGREQPRVWGGWDVCPLAVVLLLLLLLLLGSKRALVALSAVSTEKYESLAPDPDSLPHGGRSPPLSPFVTS